jgi:hypothetical protein
MLNDAQPERRTRRSNDTMTALHYQLALARQEGGFDAMVLADEAGCLVAGAGAWPTCEMLAAYAPLLGSASPGAAAALGDALSSPLEVAQLTVDGSRVLLCARGGGAARAPSLERAAAGCQRILRTEP